MSKEHMLGKIIDFEVKCNRVRFYIGLKDSRWGWTNKDYVDENGNKPVGLKPHDDYYGNNWDVIPYEHTAGRVYDEFIIGMREYYYDVDWIVVEPCMDENGSNYCKNDFKKRKVPCVIVIKDELALKHKGEKSFKYWYDFLINDGNGEDYDGQDIEAFYLEDYLMVGITIETDKCSVTF